MSQSPRTALLLGSTGLVGSHLVGLLAADTTWDRVVTLGRRPMEQGPTSHEHHIVDFEDLHVHAELFTCNVVFCCLGTTIREAGSKEAFRRVDFDYPVEAAYLAKSQGATHYLLVSSLGANAASRIFYSRTKGQVEEAVADVGFESLSVFRPSLLTGERNEPRRGEALAGLLLGLAKPLLRGPLTRYQPSSAADVARVMSDVAAGGASGRSVYEANAIRALARGT